MLTIEMLRQSSALTGLTDDQLNAIAEMSRNDENTVIGTKIGALHGQYDTDILGITGIKKKDGEKVMTMLSAYLASTKLKQSLQKQFKLSLLLLRHRSQSSSLNLKKELVMKL